MPADVTGERRGGSRAVDNVPVRRRRTTAEVRSELLAAAQELFAERGYARTSTREIAERAGVIEALLFRHFNTKSELFHQAVFNPLSRYISEYWDHWSTQDFREHTAEELGVAWVGGMYDLLHDNRRLVMAFFSAQLYEKDVADAVAQAGSPFRFLFARNETMIKEFFDSRGVTVIDPALAAEFTFGLVLSVTMLEDLLPRRRRLSRKRVVAEIATFVARAVGTL